MALNDILSESQTSGTSAGPAVDPRQSLKDFIYATQLFHGFLQVVI
jgi:hypothetical protein